MISHITGILLDTPLNNAAHLDLGQGLVYEVMVPVYAAQHLAMSQGQPVSLYTICMLEGQNQGTSFLPRLLGFPAAKDKAFFELFTTVKGIGPRKGLRAMALPPQTIAEAIANRDAKLLQSLPEIGKKMAETMIVSLQDKVKPWVEGVATAQPGRSGTGTTTSAGRKPDRSLVRDAVEGLVALGEDRLKATQWVEQVLSSEDAPGTAEAVIGAIYALKAAQS